MGVVVTKHEFDDLLGPDVKVDGIEKHKFTIDGEEVEPLDLTGTTFAAVEALLKKRNPDLLRRVFAPDVIPRRSHEEIMAIRDAARAAKNPDGTPMFDDVKDNGRIPIVIDAWYVTEYLPEQARKAAEMAAEASPETTEGDSEGDAEAIPTESPKRRK